MRSIVVPLFAVSVIAGCGGDGSLVFGETSDPCEPVVLTNDPESDDLHLDRAVTCLEVAIAAGDPFTWDLVQVTVEGDPIPLRIAYDGDAYTITEDSTHDEYGNGSVRVQRCDGLDLSGYRPTGVGCDPAEGSGFRADSLP